MPTMSTRRSRASLALGTALALIAASLTIGMSPASADGSPPGPMPRSPTTGLQSSNANKVSHWCKDGEEEQKTGTLRRREHMGAPTGTYAKVIVKAGSGKYANTIFADAPDRPARSSGRTRRRASTTFAFDDGDKQISHIILCAGFRPPPATTDLAVDQGLELRVNARTGYVNSLTETDAGTPLRDRRRQAILDPAPTWSQTDQDLPVGVSAQVSEGRSRNAAAAQRPTPARIQRLTRVFRQRRRGLAGSATFALLAKEGNTVW